jgi:hypothetical protein
LPERPLALRFRNSISDILKLDDCDILASIYEMTRPDFESTRNFFAHSWRQLSRLSVNHTRCIEHPISLRRVFFRIFYAHQI